MGMVAITAGGEVAVVIITVGAAVAVITMAGRIGGIVTDHSWTKAALRPPLSCRGILPCRLDDTSYASEACFLRCCFSWTGTTKALRLLRAPNLTDPFCESDPRSVGRNGLCSTRRAPTSRRDR